MIMIIITVMMMMMMIIIMMMMMMLIIITIIIVTVIIINDDDDDDDDDDDNHIQRRAVRDIYNLLTAPRTVSNAYARMVRAQSCANHVQHIERLSRATCRVTCHVV